MSEAIHERPRNRGTTSAATAAVLALVLAGLAVLSRRGSDVAAPVPTTTPAVVPENLPDGAEVVFADQVVPGDCLRVAAAPGSTTVQSILRVPCDAGHGFEVFAVATVEPGGAAAPVGAPFPGDTEVERLASERCLAAFEAAVAASPLPDTAPALQVQFMRPTETSWNEQADRRVVCGVAAADGTPLQGSVIGAAS